MRKLALVIGLVGWATAAVAQSSDDSERTKQRAGESGAAKSQAITPGSGLAEAHEITGTATGTVSLSTEQRNRLKAYFTRQGRPGGDEADAKFTSLGRRCRPPANPAAAPCVGTRGDPADLQG